METDNRPPAAKRLNREEFELWLLDRAMYDDKTLYLIWRCGKCGRTSIEFEVKCGSCQAERPIN